MTKVQRYLLLFFSAAILLSDSGYLKIFLSALLLFFALSPKTWWKQNPANQNEVSEDTNNEPAHDVCQQAVSGDSYGGNKQLIQVSQQSVAYCMNLYRLRIAEIVRSYNQICMNYSSSEESSWILKFLKDRAKHEGPYWDCKTEEEIKIAEEEAVIAYNKRFSDLFSWCNGPNTPAVIDIQAFLSVYSGACGGILRRLKYFKDIGFAETKVSELIENYSEVFELIDCEYEFTNFLKYYEHESEEEAQREKVRVSFTKLRSLWEEIKDLVISNLLVAADAKIDVAAHFKELEGFDTLHRCFIELLLSKNKADLERSGVNSTVEKQKAIFREHLSHYSYFHIFE